MQNINSIIYPGSFEPITNGHIDLINRASKIFDNVIVAIGVNPNKPVTIDYPTRKLLVERSLKEYGIAATVIMYEGLLVDFCREQQVYSILRGIRNVTDFEYEFQFLNINRALDSSVETVFMAPASHLGYVSSSMVRQLASMDNSLIKQFVPESVVEFYQR